MLSKTGDYRLVNVLKEESKVIQSMFFEVTERSLCIKKRESFCAKCWFILSMLHQIVLLFSLPTALSDFKQEDYGLIHNRLLL